MHSLTWAFASDPLLCISARKGGACSQRLRQKIDLRLPATPDKHALAQACYCMLVAHNDKCRNQTKFIDTLITSFLHNARLCAGSRIIAARTHKLWM